MGRNRGRQAKSLPHSALLGAHELLPHSLLRPPSLDAAGLGHMRLDARITGEVVGQRSTSVCAFWVLANLDSNHRVARAPLLWEPRPKQH